MKLPVKITQEVWQEIDDITEYIFQASDIDKIDDFYSAFEHVVTTVMENAEIGRLSDRSHDITSCHDHSKGTPCFGRLLIMSMSQYFISATLRVKKLMYQW